MSINLPKQLSSPMGLALRQGVVTGTPDNINLTCSVFIAGNDTAVSLKYMAHVAPVSDDPVWIMQNGTDMLVIGKTKIGAGGTQSASVYSDGLELYHSGSTPYIDFHRAANPAGDSNADYNIRLINNATNYLSIQCSAGADTAVLRDMAVIDFPDTLRDNKIDLYGGSYVIGVRSGEFYMKSGGNNFGFESPPGSWAMRYANEVNGTERGLRIMNSLHTSGETYTNGWFRQLTSGNGYYHQVHGGGWYMIDGLFRIYGDKEIYTNNKVRGQIARMGDGIWGDHATFGHNNYGPASDYCGLLQRWDSMVWLRSNNEINMYVSGVDIMRFKNSGGWSEITAVWPMNLCGTAAHVGGDMGGNRRQLGACSSSARWKTGIVDLPKKVRGDHNPVFSMKPRRFFWREDLKTGNGAEVNKWRPEGSTGLITEEIVEVAPEAVSREYDGTPTAPDMYAFFAYLVDAVQYLKTRLDSLEAVNG